MRETSGKTENMAMETIQAIRDYDGMVEAVENTADVIKELEEAKITPRSSVPDGMPHVHNPHAGENKLVSCIDRLDAAKARYRNARHFLLWFEPVWDALTDEERLILETFKYSEQRSGIISQTARELFYTPRQFRRVRDRTLARFQKLLYGL